MAGAGATRDSLDGSDKWLSEPDRGKGRRPGLLAYDSNLAAEQAILELGEKFLECQNCNAPVKPDWPRCPGCKHPIDKNPDQVIHSKMAERGIFGRAPSEEYPGKCEKCNAPVKTDWPRCPGCKHAISKAPDDSARAERGDFGRAPSEEFPGTCKQCNAPVKPDWPRCPGCKHPISKATDHGGSSPPPRRRPAHSLPPPPPPPVEEEEEEDTDISPDPNDGMRQA